MLALLVAAIRLWFSQHSASHCYDLHVLRLLQHLDCCCSVVVGITCFHGFIDNDSMADRAVLNDKPIIV